MTAGTPSEPTPGEIREELERVLAGPPFSSARRSSALLRYAVEQTLAGRAARLKGYAIAIDVFGKPLDFDSSTDPIVRVEARRVRQRLAQFYLDHGGNGRVRIDLPVGGYAARFTYTQASEDEAPAKPAPWRRRVCRAAAIVLAALGWCIACAERTGAPARNRHAKSRDS